LYIFSFDPFLGRRVKLNRSQAVNVHKLLTIRYLPARRTARPIGHRVIDQTSCSSSRPDNTKESATDTVTNTSIQGIHLTSARISQNVEGGGIGIEKG